MAVRSLAVAALLVCCICLSHSAPLLRGEVSQGAQGGAGENTTASDATPAVPSKAAAAAVAADDVAANWLCTPGSATMCKELPGNVFQVSNFKLYRGGMMSPALFVHGEFSVKLKLPGGYSGGTSTSWLLLDTTGSGQKSKVHSEIDFTFYGNTTADMPLVSTNVYAGGMQNLAQFRAPFDPSADFHTYTIRWNAEQIIWFIDGTALRVLDFNDTMPWPNLAMRPQLVVSNTPWTDLKPDYKEGPVTSEVTGYTQNGCFASNTDTASPGKDYCKGAFTAGLTDAQTEAGNALHDQLLIVDYGWDWA